MLIILGRRKSEPFISLDIVLGHGLALLIASAEPGLGSRKPFLSGTSNPFDPLFNIPWYPRSLKVTVSDLKFCFYGSLTSGFAEPLDRSGATFRKTATG